jgi:hypothetical protein
MKQKKMPKAKNRVPDFSKYRTLREAFSTPVDYAVIKKKLRNRNWKGPTLEKQLKSLKRFGKAFHA